MITYRRTVLALAVATALFPAATAAAVTKEQAASQIEKAYDVRVLRVRESEIDGRAVWLVTFMVSGGNSNAAFQVNSVAVDRQTGELVPSFQHKPSGYRMPDSPTYDTRVERNPDRARSSAWR